MGGGGGGTKHFFLPILYNFKNIGDGLYLSNCCLTNQKGTEWQPGQLGIGEKFLGEGGGGGGGEGHYLCREGHNFFTEQNFGRVTILFLLKLREGHKAWGFFLLQNQLILISVLVNYPPTNNCSFA